jgi:hypothetical protein
VDTHRNAFGAAERLGVTLPAPCIGHPLRDGVGSCDRASTVLLSTIIVGEDGGPVPVLITACAEHVNAVAHWLEVQGIGDGVDRWSINTFFEHARIFEESGLDWHVLRSA